MTAKPNGDDSKSSGNDGKVGNDLYDVVKAILNKVENSSSEPDIPTKSSTEILSELFGAFNAEPPKIPERVEQVTENESKPKCDDLIKKEPEEKEDPPSKVKKNKKSKKKHKHKDKKHKKKSKCSKRGNSVGSDDGRKKKSKSSKKLNSDDSDDGHKKKSKAIKKESSDDSDDDCKKNKRDTDHKKKKQQVQVKEEQQSHEQEKEKEIKIKPALEPVSVKITTDSNNKVVKRTVECVVSETVILEESKPSQNAVEKPSEPELPIEVKQEPVAAISAPQPKPAADVKGKPGKIVIKNLKFSSVFEETVRQVEEQAKLKAERYEEGEISDDSSQNKEEEEEEEEEPPLEDEPLELTPERSPVPVKNELRKHSRKHSSDEKHHHHHHHHHKSRSHSKDQRSGSQDRHHSRELSQNKKTEESQDKKNHRSRSKESLHRKRSHSHDSEMHSRQRSESQEKTKRAKHSSSVEKSESKGHSDKSKRSKHSRSHSHSRQKSESTSHSEKLKRSKRSRSRQRSESAGRNDRKHLRRSRSHSRSKRKSMSPGRSDKSKRSRRSRSRDSASHIDKHKLLEIARKNAMNLLKQGVLPSSVVTPDKVVAIKAGGKSVAELTDFCKQLSKKEAMGQLSSDSEGEEHHSSGSDTERPFHHPFQIKERPASIVMNIRNSVQLPLKTLQEKTAEQSKQLRIQFPVSSGQQHRKSEKEWVPVSPRKQEPAALVPVKAVEPKPPAEAPNQVFPPTLNTEGLDIGSIVSQRLTAMRKLQENPNDVQALSEMYRAQKDMQMWAESKQQPGQFTGSTGARVLSAAELASGFQAWAKKVQTTGLRGAGTDHLPMRGVDSVAVRDGQSWQYLLYVEVLPAAQHLKICYRLLAKLLQEKNELLGCPATVKHCLGCKGELCTIYLHVSFQIQ